MKVSDLPNNIELLKKEISIRDKEIIKRDKLIISLEEALQLMRRKKFAPTSEVSKEQLPLFNELEEILEEEVPESEDKEKKEKKPRGKRRKLPEFLPRIDKIIEPVEKEVFFAQGIELECIGEEISEQLDIIPAKVQVIRTIRKKYKTPNKDIIIGLMPPQLLPKTMAAPSLIAHIVTSKYVDALPLYRQESIFSRIDLDLNRQTMARWLIKVSKRLMPLYNLLQDHLLDKNYIHMDETRVQVLKEDGKKATSLSYMWVRRSSGKNPIVLFDYFPSRSGKVPLELLAGFKGTLQVDGYDAYSAAIKKYELKRLGCMAA